MSSSRFAPLRKSSSAIMAGMIDEKPHIAATGTAGGRVATGTGESVGDDDDNAATAPGGDDLVPTQGELPEPGPVDPDAVTGNRPSPAEQKPNPLRRFGRFLARRLEG